MLHGSEGAAAPQDRPNGTRLGSSVWRGPANTG